MNKIMFMKSHLIKWLQTKEPDAVIGLSTNAFNCPIFNFIVEEIDEDAMSVTEEYVRIKETEGLSFCYSLPSFCSNFIRSMDTNTPFNFPITAGQALNMLA